MHEIAARRAAKKSGGRRPFKEESRPARFTANPAQAWLERGFFFGVETGFGAWPSMHWTRMVYLHYQWNLQTVFPHPAPEAEELYRRWLQFLDDEFIRHSSPERRSEIVRDQLHQLYLGRPHGIKSSITLTSELPGTMLALSLDPANVTLEAEYFADTDRERYARRKPLLWFWKMFDRSPIGLNHWLGLRFRCMLGRHIFDHLGTGVKIYHGVDLTFGYNLSIGDGVTIRQGALLNDRGGHHDRQRAR